MKHERRFVGKRFDLGDGLLQRAERVRIGLLVEADVTVEICKKVKPLSAACADPSGSISGCRR